MASLTSHMSHFSKTWQGSRAHETSPAPHPPSLATQRDVLRTHAAVASHELKHDFSGEEGEKTNVRLRKNSGFHSLTMPVRLAFAPVQPLPPGLT